MLNHTQSLFFIITLIIMSSLSFANKDSIEFQDKYPNLIKSISQSNESSRGDDCSNLSSLPFVSTDLSIGVGDFGIDAISEFWTVDCPIGVNPCPGVLFPNHYQAIQAGIYDVNYTKTISGGGSDQCFYQLYVGPQGLQVELEWEWDVFGLGGSDTVDLDLHIHEPKSTLPWGSNHNSVCAWDNCTVSHISFGNGPTWFDGLAPPDPVNWFLSQVFEENACYFVPKGIGAQWQSLGMGCHNPRLDIDNISCDFNVTDPQNSSFCNPEITNIDYPPNDLWTRIGVHYYSNHGENYDVHPKINITCQGQSPITLGPIGYDQAVTFSASDGGDMFWLAADVLFHRDEDPEQTYCIVKPLYFDDVAQTPLLETVAQVETSIGPDYQVVANIESIISSDQPVYSAGSTVQYLLKVRNYGPDDLSAAQVIVSFPSILENISWVCEGDTGVFCVPSGGPGLNQLVVLPSSSEARFTIEAEIPINAIEQPIIVDVELTSPADVLDLNLENNNTTSNVSIGIFGNGFE